MEDYKIIREYDGRDFLVLIDERLREKGLKHRELVLLSLVIHYSEGLNKPVFIHPDVFKFHGFSNYLINKHKKALEEKGLVEFSIKRVAGGPPMRLVTWKKDLTDFVNE